MLKHFELERRGSSLRQEVVAGFTTFLTMAYIIFVNPQILAGAGMDAGAVLVATCLAAAFGSAVMGLYANFPVALAPGMGLNAYFAAVVVGTMGLPWQAALGAVFCSGALMLLLSVLPVREWVVNAIPRSQKYAIAAGIGFFLFVIGLRGAGIVAGSDATLVTLGNLTEWPALLAVAGFVAIVAMEHLEQPGSVLLCIVVVAGIGWFSGLSPAPESLVAAPPSLAPTAFELDIAAALEAGLLTIVFAFLMVDLFDTSGTLVAVLNEAELTDGAGRVPGLRRALVADSSATIVGSLLGTSTTTSYIESAAGVRAGGRTGITALVAAGLFLVSIGFAPLATAVPAFATAPAIMFVGCVMARAMRRVEWEDLTESVPAIVTALAMPFTYSIATGIGLGFIAHVLIKVAGGRRRELNAAVIVVAAAFALRFAVT
ncbi:MAG: NCS2 family permease [Gemmatimonadota bacterium]|nr:NCS2 family permease [Gemmatimonadota bacterium]